MGLLNLNNSENKFWTCFSTSLNANPKRIDGKQRVLSIIAEKFSYNELNNKLKVKIVLVFLLFAAKLILSLLFIYLFRYHQI
jgi:hypothetical protein